MSFILSIIITLVFGVGVILIRMKASKEPATVKKNYYSADYDEYWSAYVRDSIFSSFACRYFRGCIDGASFLAHFNLDNAV